MDPAVAAVTVHPWQNSTTYRTSASGTPFATTSRQTGSAPSHFRPPSEQVMNLVRNLSVLGIVGAALLAGVGCSSAAEEETNEDDVVTGASTPAQNDIVFEQV